MIRRVYGKANSADVTLTYKEDGRWETIIPSSPDGEYVIEIWAEDYAGNEAYIATVKYIYDTKNLCWKVVFDNYNADFSMNEIEKLLKGDFMHDLILDDFYEFILRGDDILSAVVRCEVCGE